MVEFGKVKEYIDDPSILVSAKKPGILDVLDSKGDPSGERLEFDGEDGYAVYYDPDEETVELVDGRLSRLLLRVDVSPENPPDLGVELAFERAETSRGALVSRWALADFWRAQSERIDQYPFSDADDVTEGV